MATRKTATKTSKRAGINLPASQNKKRTQKTTKSIEKNLKKTSTKSIMISIVFLLVGVLIGSGAWYITCRNDCFFNQ